MSEWIDWDKHKAELGKGVLLHLKKSGFITVGYRNEKPDGYYVQLFGDTEMLIPSNDEVSHWMPLPNPPKMN